MLGQEEMGRKWDLASDFVSCHQYDTFLRAPCCAKVSLHQDPALQAELLYFREIQLLAAVLGQRDTMTKGHCDHRCLCSAQPVTAQLLPTDSGVNRGLWAPGEGSAGIATRTWAAESFLSLLLCHRRRFLGSEICASGRQ